MGVVKRKRREPFKPWKNPKRWKKTSGKSIPGGKKITGKRPRVAILKTPRFLRAIKGQKGDFCIRKRPFIKLCLEILQDSGDFVTRMKETAVEILQASAEDFLVTMFRAGNIITQEAGRDTMSEKDLGRLSDVVKEIKIEL